jgi:hypothetical protein
VKVREAKEKAKRERDAYLQAQRRDYDRKLGDVERRKLEEEMENRRLTLTMKQQERDRLDRERQQEIYAKRDRLAMADSILKLQQYARESEEGVSSASVFSAWRIFVKEEALERKLNQEYDNKKLVDEEAIREAS